MHSIREKKNNKKNIPITSKTIHEKRQVKVRPGKGDQLTYTHNLHLEQMTFFVMPRAKRSRSYRNYKHYINSDTPSFLKVQLISIDNGRGEGVGGG